MEFKLTAHEVELGVRVRDGSLVVRPSGLMLLGIWLDVLVAVGLAAVFVALGGWWNYLAIPLFALFVIDGLMRARAAVVATGELIVVRNRTRTRRIPIAKVSRVRVDTVEGLFRQPVYTFVGWWPAREWSIGVIDLMDGSSVQCDALMSVPPRQSSVRSQPSPVETKIATLRRWLAESCR